VPFKKIEGGASLHADKKPGRLEGLRILVVEDDPVNQLLAEQVLNGWKCSVDMAVNGKIALEKVGLNDYDIVLMDIRMPVMDGYEATHRIRTQLRGQRSQVPILALTAHAALWESEKCLAIGMNGYLSKPYRLEDLYDEIIRLAGK
jgi:CheY-like chemotaxis protein